MIARTESEKRIVRRWLAKGEAKVIDTLHENYRKNGRLINYEAWVVELI